jgi:hypothetical protein
MIKWFQWLIGVAPAARAEPSGQGGGPLAMSLATVTPVNLFPGKWQGSMDGVGIYSEVIFSAEGRFSTIMQSAAGSMQRTGTYRILDEKTVLFVDDTPLHAQVMPGPFGQPVTKAVETLPQETNYYEFLNAQTMVLRASAPPYPSTTYRRVG